MLDLNLSFPYAHIVFQNVVASAVFETQARDVIRKPQSSIAQQVVGNLWKTRVTALQRDKTCKIALSYVSTLQNHGTSCMKYTQPLSVPSPVAFTLSVQ